MQREFNPPYASLRPSQPTKTVAAEHDAAVVGSDPAHSE
jgi:hypothetical protein